MLSTSQGDAGDAALRQELERLRRHLDRAQALAGLGTWEYDPETGRPAWSDQMFRIFGLDPADGPPEYTQHQRLIHPDDWPRFDQAVRHAVVRGKGYNLELRIVRPDGAQRDIATCCEVERGEDGRPLRLLGTTQDITDRKQTELALDKTAAHYRALADNLPQGAAYLFDTDLRILVAGGPELALHGFSPAQLEGHTLSEALDEETAAMLEPAYRQALEGKRSDTEIEYRGQTYLLRTGPVADAEGRVVGGVALTQNITERSVAAEALRSSEQRYRTLARSLPQGAVFLFDTEMRFLVAEGPELQATGWAPGEIEGRRLEDVLSPQMYDILGPHYRTVLRGESLETEMQSRDQTYLVRGAPFHDAQGRVAGGVILSQNITERCRAAEKLRESEARYRALLDGAPMSVLVLKQGRYVYANPYGARMLGYDSPEDLEGVEAMSTIAPESREIIAERMQRARAGEPNPTMELEVMRKDGERMPVETTSLPIRLDGEPATLIIGQDLSERRRAEAQHEALSERLREAQKYESLCTLAGGVAHHFNNLLHAILGNVEFALHAQRSRPVERECLEEIQTAAERAAHLSTQMLACSGHGAILPRPVRFDSLVRDMRGLIESSRPEGVSLEIQVAPDVPGVLGDAGQLRQALINLANNAFEALGEGGGTVRCSVDAPRCTSDDLARCRLHPEMPEGPYVRLMVSDDGEGMEDETLERIFDPFFSTRFTGRGLGLAAVLGIVRGHDGAIDVQSAPGLGTTVTVYLPAHETDEAGPPRMRQKTELATPVGVSAHTHALIVDDDPAVLKMGARILRQLGYEPLTASGGDETLETLKAHGDAIAFCLLDLEMPEWRGDEMVDTILETSPGLKIIVSTAAPPSETEERLAGKPIHGLLRKPWSLSQLRETLSAGS